ncbi:MAG: superoxide dismutase [Candidatus Peribacteraceae bacterium]|nr:superoxide dismutase [Candidatus Peribacteraceae bacterium]
MAYALPSLPYSYDALEPHIDARTMEIHHGKHHQAYCDNINKALAGTPFASRSIEDVLRHLEEIPADKRTAVCNHGGGYANHNFFWTILAPKNAGPSGTFAKTIEKSFGSLDAFKEKFSAAALGQFGSGWAWLVSNSGNLEILQTSNQDSPISAGKVPLLTIDVWEHAYYLLYQNRRADYVKAFWNIVNWEEVERRWEEAAGE